MTPQRWQLQWSGLVLKLIYCLLEKHKCKLEKETPEGQNACLIESKVKFWLNIIPRKYKGKGEVVIFRVMYSHIRLTEPWTSVEFSLPYVGYQYCSRWEIRFPKWVSKIFGLVLRSPVIGRAVFWVINHKGTDESAGHRREWWVFIFLSFLTPVGQRIFHFCIFNFSSFGVFLYGKFHFTRIGSHVLNYDLCLL